MSADKIAQALIALRSENYSAARDLMKAVKPPFELKSYLILGLTELALKEWAAAKKTFSDAGTEYPDEPNLFFNLGIAQENLGELDDAASSYETSLGILFHQPDAFGNLSNIYCKLGRFVEAETTALRALELGAPKVQALNSLGLALNRQGKWDEATKAYLEVLELEPENLFVLSNMANLCVDKLDFENAWIYFAKARAVSGNSPLVRYHEGMARLLSGNYVLGWNLYEARLELPNSLRQLPPCPRYKGEDLKGKKLLLIAEQGFGDAIQFCRYGIDLEKKGAELFWTAPDSLLKLFSFNLPGHVVSEKAQLPQVDFYLPLLSLPLVLGKLRPNEAPPAPYLKAPPSTYTLSKNKNKNIGLAWSGSSTHQRDFERSIPLTTFKPVWQKIPAHYYALFVGRGIEQITDEPVIALDDVLIDFAATASLLMQLDCLVTIDTAVAHLAGALGVKTFLLLPYCPDWRWGTKDDSVSWYSSVTLVRQKQPEEWDDVMIRLVEKMAVSL